MEFALESRLLLLLITAIRRDDLKLDSPEVARLSWKLLCLTLFLSGSENDSQDTIINKILTFGVMV